MNPHKQEISVDEIRKKNGYTLVEVIVALAICGFGLAAILGLYGIALDTRIVARNIFDQSMEINSIADEIQGGLEDETLMTLPDQVGDVLTKHQNYSLEEIRTNEDSSLHTIKISQQADQRSTKTFFIKLYWRTE